MSATLIRHKWALVICFALVLLLNPHKQSFANQPSFGRASWYGGNFHGRRTANGEYYNMYAVSAAHKKIKFDSLVKVTNLNNGQSIVVRINDRGPFIPGRDIDLSYGAAQKLGMVSDGVVPVKLEVLAKPKQYARRGGD